MPDAQWWLTHLTQCMDRRNPRIGNLRNYLEGNAPLPEGAAGCQPAYREFQRKARTNFAELVTDSTGDRMRVGWFRVGKSIEDDDDARRLWKANRLDVWAGDVHRDMLGLAHGYVCVQPGDNGVEITYERPEQVIVDHDPSRPDLRRAGLKVYRDAVQGWDAAYLHEPGVVHRYKRDIPQLAGTPEPILTYVGNWVADGTQSTGLRSIPLVPFTNRGGMGEFESHTDLLDRINWNILQRLVIIAMQAYKQRATKGDLPEVDEDGAEIDYAELFRPGPGALWRLPDGVDLWESGQADLTGILESSKADLRDLAAVTRTPMSALMPDGANQSAEGAAAAKEAQVFKAEDRNARAASSWVEALRLGLGLERGEDNVPELEVVFVPPERLSMAERYDALTKAGTDVPWRTKMTDILGFPGDKVDRMAAERAEDAMLAATLTPPTPAPAAPARPPVQDVTDPELAASSASA